MDSQEKSRTADAAARRGLRLESHQYRDTQNEDEMDYKAVCECLHFEVDAQEKSLTLDAATLDDDEEMDYMVNDFTLRCMLRRKA